MANTLQSFSGTYPAMCPGTSAFSLPIPPSLNQVCYVDSGSTISIGLPIQFDNFFCDNGFSFNSSIVYNGTDGVQTTVPAVQIYSSLPYFTSPITGTYDYLVAQTAIPDVAVVTQAVSGVLFGQGATVTYAGAASYTQGQVNTTVVSTATSTATAYFSPAPITNTTLVVTQTVNSTVTPSSTITENAGTIKTTPNLPTIATTTTLTPSTHTRTVPTVITATTTISCFTITLSMGSSSTPPAAAAASTSTISTPSSVPTKVMRFARDTPTPTFNTPNCASPSYTTVTTTFVTTDTVTTTFTSTIMSMTEVTSTTTAPTFTTYQFVLGTSTVTLPTSTYTVTTQIHAPRITVFSMLVITSTVVLPSASACPPSSPIGASPTPTMT